MSRRVQIAASLYDDIIDIVRDEADRDWTRTELADAMRAGEWVRRGRGQSCAVVLSDEAVGVLADLAEYRADYWGSAGSGDVRNPAALAAARRLVRDLAGVVSV